MTAPTHKPILPRRRPLWIVVLAGMLVFGFYQERAKVQLNHYAHVLHPKSAGFVQAVGALGPRLDAIYEKALLQNPTIPATLEKFVNGTLDGELASNVVAKGRVKWQKK